MVETFTQKKLRLLTANIKQKKRAVELLLKTCTPALPLSEGHFGLLGPQKETVQ